MAASFDFPFHHGRLALSFVGTVGDRGSTPIERLTDPGALAAWLVQAGLTADRIPLSAAALGRAVRLREAIARAVAAVRADVPPAAADIALINAAARRGSAVVLDAATLQLVEETRDPLGAALGTVARDAIALLASPDERGRLRSCAYAECGSLFLTPTGRRERRWCSMARCGNRAKVAAFRRRAGAVS
jgi:predicted RNA-binding Zn ribbon-like protein